MRLPLALLLCALALPASAQNAAPPFALELVEVDLADMPGLHSFAWAEHDGQWLFVAGRTDGLHGIIELDAFPGEQSNSTVWVVDREADQVWSRSLDELDVEIRDALSATNPQYHQEGETLYVVGGYGTDSATGEKITFPTLTTLDVPGLIEAVTTGGALAPYIRQTTDERLAVTGGELRGNGGGYTLFGGQRFDGEYSVAGTGFTQAYTERVALFSIVDEDGTLSVSDPLYLDEDLGYDPDVLHRRDMTVAPSYYRYLPVDAEDPNDTAIGEGFKLYGGVFKQDANVPHRTQIQLGFTDIPELWESEYEQQFAHYTAPALPLWDAQTETMHTAFFGGMAQFVYDEAESEVVEDLLIPFTDDIVTFTHEVTDGGDTYETVMPIQMPGLLGTNAVMIPAPGVSRSSLGIVRLREVSGRTLMGWIVGGIESTAPNPGWLGMTAAETSASDRVFAVYLTPTFSTATEDEAGPAALAFESPYPNPFRSETTVAFTLDRAADLAVEVYDALGRRVATLHDGPLGAQQHTFTFRPGNLPSGVYTVLIHGDEIRATRSVVRIR